MRFLKKEAVRKVKYQMEYDFRNIEKKWQTAWTDEQIYKVTEDTEKPKYYVLDMFPYPSGSGLHIGHPLGYIASDIYSRYKRHQGFNVLHPMGFDSFGLPAEQYAIQTGQHPAITTKENIARYVGQLEKLGMTYDWSRSFKTSDPSYFRWTQWIFKQLFNAWYNLDTNKAEPIETLIAKFEENGNYNVNAHTDSNWHKDFPVKKYNFPFGEHWEGGITATDWKSFTDEQKAVFLLQYRLAYLAETEVNWCPELGTVLANDEVKNGLSERGGHPVIRKKMMQWSMRITAYADRLLTGLDKLDWSQALKVQQTNWIGKSKGASVFFPVENHNEKIEVFTTRPDTIFGVSFMVLSPEHPMVNTITTADQKEEVTAYQEAVAAKSDVERQANAKNITGAFTGAYAVNPVSGDRVPIWIGEYVLMSYGTGAVMSVPAGDQRDWSFAKHFGIEIKDIFKDISIEESAYEEKDAVLCNSGFLDGMSYKAAVTKANEELVKIGAGQPVINYRLRDAIFGRQRYWGEPIPIYLKNDVPYLIPGDETLELPEVDKYLPTESGEPPLARATDWHYEKDGEKYPIEYSTMPGWAGSSWYFLRYCDPHNEEAFCDKRKAEYWGNVDLYIGGSEHATGHLLYSRFWTKFLYDLDLIPIDEPFKKLINQGMIQGRSSLVYRINGTNTFVSKNLKKEHKTTTLHVDISMVKNDVLDTDRFKKWRPEFADAEFILEDGKYVCGSEVEKMSKRWYNVINPDDLCEEYGADTLRCYEMFLGPLEQHKPWDTKGISGVHNFLRKSVRLFEDVSDEQPSDEALKSLHKCIKQVTQDLDRYSFNTNVSTFMILVNELTAQPVKYKAILREYSVMLSPYAPHLAEELWHKLGHTDSVLNQSWPKFEEKYLVESNIEYPVSFNGKMRFKLQVPADLGKDEVEKLVLENEQSSKYLEGKSPKKVIVVPGRIVNVVV